MKELNLKTLTVTNLDGTETEIEFAKNLAQVVYQNARNLDQHMLAKELFEDCKVANTLENRAKLIEFTEIGFAFYVRQALKKKLDETR